MTHEEIAAQALAVHARISLIRKILLDNHEVQSTDLSDRMPEKDWAEKYAVALKMAKELESGVPDPQLRVHKIQNYL